MNSMTSVRHALMELTMFGEYGVSDRVGICEFIEKLDNSQLEELTENIIMLEKQNGCKTYLESKYQESLTQQKINVSYMSESSFSNHRNQILLQETDDSSGNTTQLRYLLKTGGVMAAAAYIVKLMAENPADAGKQLTNLRIISHERYNDIVAAIHRITKGRIDLPQTHKTVGALQDLHSKYKSAIDPLSGKFTGYTPQHKIDIDQAKETVRQASKEDRGQLGSKISAMLRRNGKILAGAAGVTGLAIILNHIYQRYLSTAAKNCRGKSGRSAIVCINTYK